MYVNLCRYVCKLCMCVCMYVNLCMYVCKLCMYVCLLYRSDEIPGFFILLKKSYRHRAQWRYYLYLSRVRILVSPWLLTWLANNERASRSGARPIILKLCRNFISSYKYWWSFAHSWEILSALEYKTRIPSRPCNILYIYAFIKVEPYAIDLFSLYVMLRSQENFHLCRL